MAKPDTLIIDGHAFSWQRIVELRKQQVEAHRTAPCRQPALFELKGRHAPGGGTHRSRALSGNELIRV
jgi:hypothetical protein